MLTTNDRVLCPDGRLITWRLGANERGSIERVYGGESVHVSGVLGGARVRFIAAHSEVHDGSPLFDDGTAFVITAPCFRRLPVCPVTMYAEAVGGDPATTDITVTIFLGD